MLLESLISYKQFQDERGCLGVIDDRDIPFKIKRVFWIRDVPPKETRGHHSHKECEQAIVCIKGSFDVLLDNARYELKQMSGALHLPTDTHIILEKFSPDAVCLVLCSEYYNKDDYES